MSGLATGPPSPPPSSKAPLLDEVRRRRAELYELCASLIRIPSENPPGDTTALVAFVTEYLTARGLKPQIHAPKPEMPNVVATLGAGRRNLVLSGHLDEFPAGDGWTFPPFAGALADGKIMGRGAGDMKSGLAVAMFLVWLLRERDVKLDGRLTIAFASDEETGGRWGTEWLLANVPDVRGDACLIGESSGTWSIGIGEKGVLLGTTPSPVIRLGYTDGRFFRREGIPTAVYGPRVHRMGGPDEYVEQDEVLQVALVHLGTVLDYLGAR